MRYMTILFILAFALSPVAHARPYELIKEHSHIGFDVDYMKMTKVTGHFKDYQGFFDLNEAGTEISNIRVEVRGETVDSNDGKRDFHLKDHEFFFVAKYPYISFKAQGPVKISEGQPFEINGELTMRGIPRPQLLKGIYKGKMKDPWGKDNHFFTFTGELNRKDFGMVWNNDMDTGGYLVGDIVRLNLTAQTQALGDKTPFSTHMIPHTKGIQERRDLKAGKIKKLSTSTDPKDHK